MFTESAYPNVLLGVSQQSYQDRLPGQVSEQTNMLSDIATGIRRRPNLVLNRFLTSNMIPVIHPYPPRNFISTYRTNVSGRELLFVVNTYDYSMFCIDENNGASSDKVFNTYIGQGADGTTNNLRWVTLNDAVYLLNTTKIIHKEDSPDKVNYPNPANWGYMYIAAGAYRKTYDLTYTDPDSGTSLTVSYTTPAGANATEVAQSTPEYIATRLADLAAAAWTAYNISVYRTGAYVAFNSTTNGVTLSTGSGEIYIKTSANMLVRAAADLPATLPDQANNIIVAVGNNKSKTYFRWSSETKTWLEDASYDSLDVITGMPLQITVEPLPNTIPQLTVNSIEVERRSAGDDESNPLPQFVTRDWRGRTGSGMTTFQGRLIIFYDEYVCMSASDNPNRWVRSSVSSVLDNDPIEIAAQGTLTSPYEYGIAFNKDLIVFSKEYQAVIPGAGIITPRTAVITLNTMYEIDTTCSPVACGRSVFFTSPRAGDWLSVNELIPSSYTDSQYTAESISRHLPQYISGSTSFIKASTTSNILVFGTTGNHRELLIHEYMWSGDQKVLSAFHKWTTDFDIVDCYFVTDVLHIIIGIEAPVINDPNNKFIQYFDYTVDLQSGVGDSTGVTPYLDFAETKTPIYDSFLGRYIISINRERIPVGKQVQLVRIQGENKYIPYTPEDLNPTGTAILVLDDMKGTDVYIAGTPYTSVLELTPPTLKDAAEIPITTSKGVLRSFRVSLNNSGRYRYSVSDIGRTGTLYDMSPVTMWNPAIMPDKPLTATAIMTLPARTDLLSSRLRIETDSVYNLNILSIEYDFKYNQRAPRRT